MRASLVRPIAFIGFSLWSVHAVAQSAEPLKFARFAHIANDGTISLPVS